MPLTTDEMDKIIVDEMSGREPRVVGEEADEFREKIKTDIETAKENGWDVRIPSEIEVDTEGELD